ncbi:hypothetical protein [Dubosiella newyorkensis]|uniref:hypothetical protein n=1 Tax=Dubosiella newyorkensis TaxID=1862672 RepID=UPI003F662715
MKRFSIFSFPALDQPKEQIIGFSTLRFGKQREHRVFGNSGRRENPMAVLSLGIRSQPKEEATAPNYSSNANASSSS